MKKLSKVLSLVLVIAMVFSLCVIGASASYADFTDTDKITDTYKEAVDTMTGVGIIDGMTATTFNAQGNFTRAQAAKIIAYMQLGPTAAAALKGTGTSFKDVPATFWAAPYITYCAQMSIIGGYGNGNFGPNDALTGYQFAKMLLCAVGYGVNKEYTGNSWSINVAKDALSKGVFDDVLSASTNAVITREQATQMAFNTLTGVSKVAYSALYGDYITYGVTNSSGVNSYGTLGTTVFRLAKQTVNNDYGMTGHVWYTDTYKPANVVSAWYQNDTVLVSWTDNHTAATDTTVETALAGYTFDNTYYGATTTGMNKVVNGIYSHETLTVAAIKALTANGTKVEVVVNSDNEIVKVVVTETVLVSVTAKDLDKKTVTVSDGTNSVTLSATSAAANYGDAYTTLYAMSVEDVALVVEQTSANVITKILNVAAPKTASGKYTASTTSPATYTVGGTAYGVSAKAGSVPTTLNNAYTVVLDTYGYIIAAKDYVGTTNYAFVLNVSRDGTAMSGYTYSAQLLFPDASVKWVSIASMDGVATEAAKTAAVVTTPITGKFVAYEAKDAGYALTDVSAKQEAATGDLVKNVATYNGKIVTNSTAFVMMTGTAAAPAYTAYTGIANVPAKTTVATGFGLKNATNNGYVFVVGTELTAVASTDVVYIYNATPVGTGLTAAGLATQTYQAVVNGVNGTVTALSTVTLAKGVYVGNTYDAAGVITVAGSALAASNEVGKSANYTLSTTDKNSVRYYTTANNDKVTLSGGVLTVAGTYNVVGAVADGFACYVVNNTANTCAAKTLTSNAFTVGTAGTVYFAIDANGLVAYAIIVA